MTSKRRLHGADRAPSATVRVLLVSPEFPPQRSAGALRWEQMARILGESGWGFDVVTIDPGTLDAADRERMEALPSTVRVFGAEQRDSWIEGVLLALWRPLRRLAESRGASSPPNAAPSSSDAEADAWTPIQSHTPPSGLRGSISAWLDEQNDLPWVREASSVAERLLDEEHYDLIVSCGPPHCAHEVARRAKQLSPAPWVADFRDPFAIFEPATLAFVHPWARRSAARREARLVPDTALLVMNTERAARAMRERYPESAAPIVAVRNGWDGERIGARREEECFRIVYAGSVYLDRDPSGLFEAVARLVEVRGLSSGQCRLTIIGTNNSASLKARAAQFGIEAYLEVRAPLPRAELLSFLSTASVLVSLPQGHNLAIPSKIYEYMVFDAWLVVIATEESATAELLRGSQAVVVDPQDREGLIRKIDEIYERAQSGEMPPRLTDEPDFSRRRQVEVFRAALAEAGILGDEA